MTQEEITQLEHLLCKYQNYVHPNGSNICIVPGVIQDGYFVALYDSKGEPFKTFNGPTLSKIAADILGPAPQTDFTPDEPMMGRSY